MATDPLVSVILPVYNREASVARSIESVLHQTYRSFELIVIDDGSTDGTKRVLESFGSRIVVLEQAHAGAYVARNRGIQHARGELIAFIDSDDAWLPTRLGSQLPLMQRADVGLVFGDAIHVTLGGRTSLSCFRVSPPRRGRVAAELVWSNFIPTITVLVRRRCLDEIGGFPTTSALSADYLTWFRVAQRHDVEYVDAVVAEYTVHPNGMSWDLGRSIEARIRLFSSELAQTSDVATRSVLRRLLFNLSLRLGLAAIRGRARNVVRPLHLAWRTAAAAARREASSWAFAFAVHEVRNRTRRLFS